MYRLAFVYTIALVAGTVTGSCERCKEAAGTVEFYLLEDYDRVGQTCEIDLSSVELAGESLIGYDDIRSYNSNTFTFSITSGAREAVEAVEHSVSGRAFAVTAGGEVVYTGYFWPAYSSLSCQWIVIDPLFLSGENKLTVQLGYAGPIEGVDIPDERNNPAILAILRRDGKLID